MNKPPAVAYVLGLAGLLPFIACAAALWGGAVHAADAGDLALSADANDMAEAIEWIADVLLVYAAVILGFLGGIHWGMAMRGGVAATGRLLWGVLPSLLGWGAWLVASIWSASAGLGMAAAALALSLAADAALYRSAGLSAWLPLRSLLTAVAASCCAVGAWAVAGM
jgi:Protein of unknown function (DUF3429)